MKRSRPRLCDSCGARPWSAITFAVNLRRCIGCWLRALDRLREAA